MHQEEHHLNKYHVVVLSVRRLVFGAFAFPELLQCKTVCRAPVYAVMHCHSSCKLRAWEACLILGLQGWESRLWIEPLALYHTQRIRALNPQNLQMM